MEWLWYYQQVLVLILLFSFTKKFLGILHEKDILTPTKIIQKERYKYLLLYPHVSLKKKDLVTSSALSVRRRNLHQRPRTTLAHLAAHPRDYTDKTTLFRRYTPKLISPWKKKYIKTLYTHARARDSPRYRAAIKKDPRLSLPFPVSLKLSLSKLRSRERVVVCLRGRNTQSAAGISELSAAYLNKLHARSLPSVFFRFLHARWNQQLIMASDVFCCAVQGRCERLTRCTCGDTRRILEMGDEMSFLKFL